MRSQETELQTQLLTPHQENALLHDLMNQIRSASESLDTKNLGFAQQVQTEKFELSRAQTEVSHLRSSMGRNPTTETRDAEDLQHLREDNLSPGRDNLRQSAEIDRLTLNSGAAELETARIQSQGEVAQNALNSWSRAGGPTGVGSRNSTLLTHTPLEVHLSLLYKISPSQAQFPLDDLVFLS